MKQTSTKRNAPPSPPRGPCRQRGAWRCAFGRLGRITTKTETVHGQTTTHAYRYDLAGRLDQVSVNGSVVEAYSYDPNGNRQTLTRGSHTITYQHDAQDRLLTQGDCTYTYTPAGSLETKTCGSHTTHYTYTAHGDLTAALLPDGTSLDYVIDGRGRRLGKRINGELVQGFVYQDQLNPVAELDGQGNVKATFAYADRAHVPSLMHRAGKTYRLIADHLGSVRLVVDIDTGQIAQRLDYDAWGNVLTDTHPGFQPFGYAGGIYDRDLNLVRFGARDYDPETGRWTAKDPIRFDAGQVSFYAYVDGDPVNRADPVGLEWVTVGYDYHGVKNWTMAFSNRLATLGAGEVMSFRNCIGCTRDVIQEWQADEGVCRADEPFHGQTRRIRQTFGEFPDSWAIGGSSWHWSPPVPNRTAR